MALRGFRFQGCLSSSRCTGGWMCSHGGGGRGGWIGGPRMDRRPPHAQVGCQARWLKQRAMVRLTLQANNMDVKGTERV
eukprot:755646-Hanusia_phi.AAC.2